MVLSGVLSGCAVSCGSSDSGRVFGHDCPLFKWPQTRPEFWRDKIGRNRTNDAKAQAALHERGWRVATVWECALRGANRDLDGVLQRLIDWLQGEAASFEERA